MEEQVISISEIIDAVKKRWKIIALTTVLATVVSGIFSFFVISPTYEASTKVFIGKEGAESEGYNSSDVSMYQNLIKTYSELIKTKDLVNKAIDNSEYDLIKSVIENHNEYRLPENISNRCKTFSNILRDADKIDILYESVEMFWKGKEHIIENSTITEDVPKDSLAIARERQLNKEGWNKNK